MFNTTLFTLLSARAVAYAAAGFVGGTALKEMGANRRHAKDLQLEGFKLLPQNDQRDILLSARTIFLKLVNQADKEKEEQKSLPNLNAVKSITIDDLAVQMKTGFDGVNSTINTVKTDVELLKNTVHTLNSVVDTMKTDVTSVKTDLSTLTDNVNKLTNVTGTVKTDVKTLTTDLNTLGSTVDKLAGTVKTVKVDFQALADKVTAIDGRLKKANIA